MDSDRFWTLVSRYLADEITPDEERELNRIVEESPENRHRFDALVQYWGKQRDEASLKKAYDKVWSKIQHTAAPEEETAKSRSPVWFSLKIAASVTVLVCAAVFVFNTLDTSSELWASLTWQEEKNGLGERSKHTLPDGTTVWLNAESKLVFPEDFDGENREVYLTGEAFFEVVKNPSKPFVIHLSNGDVRVLGTSFNIKAFEGDPVIETSVHTGRVAFIPNDPAETGLDTVFLTPNQKAVYTVDTHKTSTIETNSSDDKAWTVGRMVFISERFESVAKVLERMYGKHVVFDTDSIRNCRLTGTFQNNTLEEVMMLLAETKDYKFSVNNNELHVSGTGCSDSVPQ